jgi:hypothetical protein
MLQLAVVIAEDDSENVRPLLCESALDTPGDENEN